MTRFESPESAFLSPLRADWTIVQFLEWIGADDVRCLDVRLFGTLDAIDRALSPSPAVVMAGVVTLVRSLAMRVAAEPGVGERTLGEFVGASEPEDSAPAGVDVLVPV